MMKHVWSILCERTSIDRETNLVSYFSAVEAIRVKRLPFRIPFLVLGTLWHSNTDQGASIELKLTRVNPDASEQQIIDPFKTDSSAKRHRVNILLNGLEFSQSGTYIFRLERVKGKSWESVSEIPFDLTVEAKGEEIANQDLLEGTSKSARTRKTGSKK